MHVPEDAPADCPVCETAYDSVSVHDHGVMVNLLDNEQYRRVCLEPTTCDGSAVVRFYHHTHDQTDAHDADADWRTVPTDPDSDAGPGLESGN